jgi:hypothetical protein
LLTKSCKNPICPEINPQPIDNFYIRSEKRGGGPETRCKTCIKAKVKQWATDNEEQVKAKNKERRDRLENKQRAKEYAKTYREENHDELTRNNRNYYEENKEDYAIKSKVYRKLKEKELKITKKIYEEKNRKELQAYRRKYWRERKKKEPLLKLKLSVRGRLSKILKAKGFKKDKRSVELLGCTWNDFMVEVESNWQPGMTWDNYGCKMDQWCLDHTIPLALAQTIEEVNKLSHHSNVKPMWSIYNAMKINMMPEEWLTYKARNNIDESVQPPSIAPLPNQLAQP